MHPVPTMCEYRAKQSTEDAVMTAAVTNTALMGLASHYPDNDVKFFVCLLFLGLHPWYMEVPRLGVKTELQLLAYTTATATQDPTCICNLHHSSRQHRILNPLSKARDPTRNFMVPSRIC